jgi:hypothetical protein
LVLAVGPAPAIWRVAAVPEVQPARRRSIGSRTGALVVTIETTADMKIERHQPPAIAQCRPVRRVRQAKLTA